MSPRFSKTCTIFCNSGKPLPPDSTYLCHRNRTKGGICIDAMTGKTLDIKTVQECNRCLGSQTWHPQATLIDLENPRLEQDAVKFEFYAILLIEECPDGCCCCGRKYYDFANATMVFLKPGEIFSMSRENLLPDKGWLLAFDPALLFCTTLRTHISDYTFFNYRKEEALHLSQRETATITCCLENIEEELHHPIDRHTSTILSRHIELMLDYCARFYERQFITRENKNKALMKRFAREADEYIASGQLQGGRLPQSESFARSLGLSVAYFDDLLFFETGQSLAEYFRLKQLEYAKQMLTDPTQTPASVAHYLGFPSVQHFTFLFKKLTGIGPNEYRFGRN